MRILILFFLICPSLSLMAQQVQGYIYDTQGNPLPYATIYVKETGSGTVTNADAFYQIKLEPGEYTMVYQFIGYKAVQKKVTLGDETIEVDIRLEPETLVLREVNVRAGKEDPAYAIMRRAIAKAGFHLNQLDTFSAKVYIKGTGQVKDTPFFLRKTLEKDGLDTSRLFISESVNEISFKRPDTYSERVISIRSTGDDNNTNPNIYIFTSFYEPEVAGAITPLSPKAFAYYRFEYEGTFQDEGAEVSKIKVTPRSKGDDLFQGYINIVEDQWAIHSLNLYGTKLGFTFHIKQIYKPIEPRIWLPISHNIKFEGSLLGFEFEYKYLASVSDYYLEKNPELDFDLVVIDEKTAPDTADEVKDRMKDEEVQKLEELVATKEVNRKQLKKLVKEYEKIEKELEEQEDVESISFFKVDSMAYTMDSTYWERMRPIPLNEKEVESYDFVDSLAVVRKAEAEGDTLRQERKNNRAGFQPKDLVFGDTYILNDKYRLEVKSLLKNFQFNTVEGYVLDGGLSLSRNYKEKHFFWKISPSARYAFARETLTGRGAVQLGFGERARRSNVYLSGGRNVQQFNPAEPITPWVNTLMTLLLERNYMRLYEHDFLNAGYQKKFGDKFEVSLSGGWSRRYLLENNSDSKIINRDAVETYLPNQPVNAELATTAFPTHEAATFGINMEAKPWLKYRIRNGRKISINGSSPLLTLDYRGARPLGNTTVDYDRIELGIKHQFDVGIRGTLDYNFKAGVFFNNDQMYFMDYQHFAGNQTPIVTTDRVSNFRLLDYYRFSTNDEYLVGHLNYQFRKFLLTRLTAVRMMGLRESLLYNYLYTPSSQNYMEVGYSLDYILRVFRIEVVSSFIDGKYQDTGIRVGIAVSPFDL